MCDDDDDDDETWVVMGFDGALLVQSSLRQKNNNIKKRFNADIIKQLMILMVDGRWSCSCGNEQKTNIKL